MDAMIQHISSSLFHLIFNVLHTQIGDQSVVALLVHIVVMIHVAFYLNSSTSCLVKLYQDLVKIRQDRATLALEHFLNVMPGDPSE